MQLYKELWNAFNDIHFEEVGHKYTDSVGTKYTSVTTFIGQLEPDKDWDMIAEKASQKLGGKYYGKQVADIRAEWKQTGDYACTLGTAVHSVAEFEWQNKEFYPDYNELDKFEGMREDFEWRKKKAKSLIATLKERYIPIKNEFIVYDRDWGLVGTIDFLCYNKIKDCYAILDWKTSKKFDHTNRYQKMKEPFNTEDDCNCNHYSMQLSLYKAILEKHCPSMKIGEMMLVQIPCKETAKSEIFLCKDYSQKLIEYLDSRIINTKPCKKDKK